MSDYIICCCAKNEERYIIEWLEHNFELGFDKVIIYDNNDDPEKLPSVLNKYPRQNKVVIRPICGQHDFQLRVYEECLKNDTFKWCAFIDVDEFIELKNHVNIKEYLDSFPSKVNAVAIHWLCYGSNGEKHYRNAPMKERFPNPHFPIDGYGNKNKHIKSIVRKGVKSTIWPTPHFVNIPENEYAANDGKQFVPSNGERSMSDNIDYSSALIHHYLIKSSEEFNARNKNRKVSGTSKRVWNERAKLRMKNKDILDNDIHTTDIMRDMAYYTPGTMSANAILIRSTFPPTILGCLKRGKHIMLTGPDKKGKALNRYLNTAFANRVAHIDWTQDDAAVDENIYDIVIN